MPPNGLRFNTAPAGQIATGIGSGSEHDPSIKMLLDSGYCCAASGAWGDGSNQSDCLDVAARMSGFDALYRRSASHFLMLIVPKKARPRPHFAAQNHCVAQLAWVSRKLTSLKQPRHLIPPSLRYSGREPPVGPQGGGYRLCALLWPCSGCAVLMPLYKFRSSTSPVELLSASAQNIKSPVKCSPTVVTQSLMNQSPCPRFWL